jgi:hypothetical protein
MTPIQELGFPDGLCVMLKSATHPAPVAISPVFPMIHGPNPSLGLSA